MLQISPTARVSPHADVEDSVRGSRIVIGARSVVLPRELRLRGILLPGPSWGNGKGGL